MDSKGNSRNKNWVFISIIIGLLILLIISFIFNMMKCDDLRGRITLGELYNDFKGNDDPNSRMTAAVDISTKEGACSFDVFYEYDDYREVNSNYITPPLSQSEEKNIETEIADIIREARDNDDEFVKRIREKYDIEEHLLNELGRDINKIKEIVINKIQNDKDICKRYQYPSGEKKFYNRLLDEEYISRH